MSGNTVYVIHWHQKQRNAHQADSGVELTDEPERDGELLFVLESSLAPDVAERTVRLVELRHELDST